MPPPPPATPPQPPTAAASALPRPPPPPSHCRRPTCTAAPPHIHSRYPTTASPTHLHRRALPPPPPAQPTAIAAPSHHSAPVFCLLTPSPHPPHLHRRSPFYRPHRLASHPTSSRIYWPTWVCFSTGNCIVSPFVPTHYSLCCGKSRPCLKLPYHPAVVEVVAR
ncbi:hypothetical protein ACQJBY_004778 [Aegilops geniculata]